MKATYLGLALAVVVSLVAANPLYGQSYDRLGSHCEILECTECHVKEPVWEVDVLETAPLKEGFACTNCHTADTREADRYVLEQLATLPPAVSSSTCNDITVSSHYNSANGTWSIMVETGGISGNLKHVSAWVQCDVDGDSPCGLSCTSVDRNSECNDSTFALSSASQCISRWCFIPGSWTPPFFIRDGLLLQTKPTPYEIRAYAVSAPECDSAHNWLYHCCDTVIVNPTPELHAEAPPTASAGVPWQMTVSAEDGSGNALVNYAGFVTFSLGQTTTPYSAGPPEAGTRPPLAYTFVPFLGGDAGSRVFNVSSYTAGTVEVVAGDGITTDAVTVQVGPGEPNCVQRLIPDPPKPPKDPPNIEITSPAGAGGYTIETECPPMSVTPPYIPADGVTEATVEVTGITDAYGNGVITGLVTVESAVGTIVAFDEDLVINGIQVSLEEHAGTGTGTASFNVRARTVGEKGAVTMKNLTGAVLAQDELTIVAVEITPPSMNATESLTSGTFTCTVTPSGLIPTFQWLTGESEGAWPPGVGNSPELNYSMPTDSSTEINHTRWFADPDDRHWLVTGSNCTYTINCEVTIDTFSSRDVSPAQLVVTADASGSTSWPQFADVGSIVISTRLVGGSTEWYVNGQGTFHRTPPVKTINVPAASQFYDKVDTHESKHVTQWTSEAPWNDLFNADGLYNSTLRFLTSLVSEADLRDQIINALSIQESADALVAVDTRVIAKSLRSHSTELLSLTIKNLTTVRCR